MGKKKQKNEKELAETELAARSDLPVQAPNNKTTCDEPGYLFWKIQSQLAKLTNRLREEKKIILQKSPPQSSQPSKDQD